MLKIIILVFSLVISAYAVNTAELNINDKDLELNAKIDVGQYQEYARPNTIFLGARFLKPDRDRIYSELYEMNILMLKRIENSDFSIGMGMKLNTTKDFSALPLGMEAIYHLPITSQFPMSLNGSVYYAPQSLSFSDGKNYFEHKVSFDVEIMEHAFVLAGYRDIDIKYVNNKKFLNYNRSFYFGFKLGF